MALTNSQQRYGVIAIALHWMGALAVLVMLATAIASANASSREAAIGLMKLHGSIGVLVYLLLAARIASSMIQRRPSPLGPAGPLNGVARGVHIALLALIAIQLVTGPLDIWSGGWPISVFDLGAIPSPFGSYEQPWHDAIGVIHTWSGLAIAGLLLLHIGAALKHWLLDRDLVLPRMIGLGGSTSIECLDPVTCSARDSAATSDGRLQ
jgi:cytochrome b561